MAAFDTLAAIFPGHVAPIIKQSGDGARELVLRSWGFVLLRDGYAPKRVTNTRDDKVQTKFWKDSFDKRRCLVPATAFCEPDEGKPARWHWFALNGEEERPLFAFAGIYRQWKGPIKKAGPNVDIEVPAIDHLRWKLNSHPLALQFHTVTEIEGEIASPHIMIVQPVRFHSQRSLSFQPVDVAVAARFRGLGISERFMNEEWRLMKEDQRYKQEFLLKLYIRGWHPATRRIRKRMRVSGYAFGNKFIAFQRPNSAPLPSDQDASYALRDVQSFDEHIDTFWEEASRPFTFCVDRTSAYLNWRYDPRAGVFTITIAEEDGHVLGYVVSCTSSAVGFIADLIALPERLDVARSLALAALTRLDLLRRSDTPLHLTAGDTDLV
jgi:hypothetical protein